MARIAQIEAVSAPVRTLNHSPRVTKVKVIIPTIMALKKLVEKAGLSFPTIVGIIEGKNAN